MQKLFLTFRTIFSPCSAKRRASEKDLPVLCLKLGSCIIQQEMDIVDSNVCHDKCLTRNKGKTAIVTELHYFLTYSKCPFSQCNILTNQWTTDYGLMVSRSKIHNGRNPHPKIPKNQNIPLKCMKCLNYQF